MSPGPDVSVVIATHNRARLLTRLVDALRAQEGAPPFEIVVVDDGSTDDTPRVLAALDGVRIIRLERNRGPAAARNAGWRAAAAPLVAFTDDDCIPQPGWLAALTSGFAHGDIVQGRTMGNPTQPRDGPFAWSPETLEPNGFYETCNIAYRHEALAEVGGFDEGFRTAPSRARDRGRYVAPAWGEDTDLALRSREAGATITFADDAVVWHDIKPGGFAGRLRDLPRRGGLVALVRRHPELRRRYAVRWVSQPAHGYVLAATVGGAFLAIRPRDAGRWVAAAALATPWVLERGRYYPRRSWPSTLPQWFVVDLAEVAIMAVASARQRTLLL